MKSLVAGFILGFMIAYAMRAEQISTDFHPL